MSTKMKSKDRYLRKSYAMSRMALAIRRAIEAQTISEKDNAARWVAAWGLLCGIRSRPVRLKQSKLLRNRRYGDPDMNIGALELSEAGNAPTGPLLSNMAGAPGVCAFLQGGEHTNRMSAESPDPAGKT
jgi:hypothetical protein